MASTTSIPICLIPLRPMRLRQGDFRLLLIYQHLTSGPHVEKSLAAGFSVSDRSVAWIDISSAQSPINLTPRPAGKLLRPDQRYPIERRTDIFKQEPMGIPRVRATTRPQSIKLRTGSLGHDRLLVIVIGTRHGAVDNALLVSSEAPAKEQCRGSGHDQNAPGDASRQAKQTYSSARNYNLYNTSPTFND